VRVATAAHEAHGLTRVEARLLRLGPGIDLDIKPWPPLLPGDFLGQFGGDLVAVDGLDHVEQGDRVPGLVGLQRSDQAQLDIGELGLQCRPFGLRLLDPVFTEHALAGVDGRADRGGVEGLGNGHQRHRPGGPVVLFLRAGDFGPDGGKSGDDVVHVLPLNS
jgi:hypothetical protein